MLIGVSYILDGVKQHFKVN